MSDPRNPPEWEAEFAAMEAEIAAERERAAREQALDRLRHAQIAMIREGLIWSALYRELAAYLLLVENDATFFDEARVNNLYSRVMQF